MTFVECRLGIVQQKLISDKKKILDDGGSEFCLFILLYVFS